MTHIAIPDSQEDLSVAAEYGADLGNAFIQIINAAVSKAANEPFSKFYEIVADSVSDFANGEALVVVRDRHDLIGSDRRRICDFSCFAAQFFL